MSSGHIQSCNNLMNMSFCTMSCTCKWSCNTLQWSHNGRDSVSNNQPHDCLLNRLFRRRSKKTAKLRITGLFAANSPVQHKCPVTRKMFPLDDVIMIRYDDFMKWKHFGRYWPFVWGIQWLPVNSPLKGQWRGAFMFSLICTWTNNWVNNRDAGDLWRRRAHYDVIAMIMQNVNNLQCWVVWISTVEYHTYNGVLAGASVHNFLWMVYISVVITMIEYL